MNDQERKIPWFLTKRFRTVADFVMYVCIALLIVVPVRFFVAEPFVVAGSSMVPTFHARDYLVIDRLSYLINDPSRGDVVIFMYPFDPGQYFIKRIIGLPGEIVSVHGDRVSVHNATSSVEYVLAEPYALKLQSKDGKPSSVTLTENEYFVLGDNREVSSDSRTWGPIQEKFIVGRVLLRLWPTRDFGYMPGAAIIASTTSEISQKARTASPLQLNPEYKFVGKLRKIGSHMSGGDKQEQYEVSVLNVLKGNMRAESVTVDTLHCDFPYEKIDSGARYVILANYDATHRWYRCTKVYPF